jgi:50S ribosomal subunit-associated GTPase HflX
MLVELEGSEKNVIILANKIDKLKNSEYKKKLQEIQYKVGDHKVIPFSAKKKTGVGLLVNELFN